MYTAKKTHLTKDKGSFGFTAEFYKDGALFEAINYTNLKNPATADQFIATQIKQYELIDTITVDSFEGDYTAETLTPEQQKEAEYVFKKMALSSAKNDLDCGIISQEEYDAKLVEVKEAKPLEAIKK